MEPIATYDEILAMDESTFVKTFKEKQLVEAKKVMDAKAQSAVISARDKELSDFDNETRNQIASLESTRSVARTAVEKKYAALTPVIAIPITNEVVKGL